MTLRLLVLLVVLVSLVSPLRAARDFDGSTARIDAGNPSLGLTTTYTVACWVRPDDVSTTRTWAKWGTTASTNPFLFLFGQTSAAIRFFVRDDSAVGANATKAAVLSTSTWTHVAGTRNGDDVQVYADGAAGTSANAAIGTISINNLRIGAADDGAGGLIQHFDGRVAEFAIWDVVLSTDEIASLSAGISPRHVRPVSLVFYTPLVRDITELRQPVTLTDNSSTAADHPRIYR